jgi:hypothetical protein
VILEAHGTTRGRTTGAAADDGADAVNRVYRVFDGTTGPPERPAKARSAQPPLSPPPLSQASPCPLLSWRFGSGIQCVGEPSIAERSPLSVGLPQPGPSLPRSLQQPTRILCGDRSSDGYMGPTIPTMIAPKNTSVLSVTAHAVQARSLSMVAPSRI